MTQTTSRREFMKAAALTSAAVPFAGGLGLNFGLMNAAVGQTRPTDYKAIICIFLAGGNDSFNMVLPTDSASWGRYLATRNQGFDPIALREVGVAPGGDSIIPQMGGVLPLTMPATMRDESNRARAIAVHPAMAGVRNLFNAGRLAIVPNVGPMVVPTSRDDFFRRAVPLPRGLLSHSDQTATWLSGPVYNSASGVTGWAGRMGDLVASQNATTSLSSISATGNTMWLAGRDNPQYRLGSPAIPQQGSLFGAAGGHAAAAQILRRDPAGLFSKDYGTILRRSMALQASVASAVAAASVPAPSQFFNPRFRVLQNNPVAQGMQQILRMIAARNALGLRRQIFFYNFGGFDTHDGQNIAHSICMAQLSHALEYLDTALASLGGVDMRASVTTITMSEFGRTFTTNGDGTDHGWGGHQFVMGGAVRGGDIHGRFPTIGTNATGFVNQDSIGGAGELLPQFSVDQFAATLGRWYGLSEAQLDLVMPQLASFNSAPGGRDLGFML